MISKERNFNVEFYGDHFRWFVGTVEDINDPMKLGRVRVRVRGIHTANQSNIGTGDLPWAQVGIPTTEGGVSGIGRNTGILPGATVIGFFLDGKASQLPLITAVLHKIENVTDVQTWNSIDPKLARTRGLDGTSGGYGTTGVRNGTEPGAGINMDELGNTNTEIAYNYFISYGFTPQQSAGIVGNLIVESRMNTSAEAAGAEESWGIAQWNAATPRFNLLKSFALDLGKDWKDLEVQLKFITWELENYPYLGLSKLKSANTIEDSTVAFQQNYERCSICHTNTRIAAARDTYMRYSQ